MQAASRQQAGPNQMHAGEAAGQTGGMLSQTGEVAGETWEPVVSYPLLVEYLVQQGGPGTRVQVLPFEGANKVVFRK